MLSPSLHLDRQTQVCEDIKAILHIEGCEAFRSSVDRPNLEYQVGGRIDAPCLFAQTWCLEHPGKQNRALAGWLQRRDPLAPHPPWHCTVERLPTLPPCPRPAPPPAKVLHKSDKADEAAAQIAAYIRQAGASFEKGGV